MNFLKNTLFQNWQEKPENLTDLLLILTFTVIFSGFFFIHASYHRDLGYIAIFLSLFFFFQNNFKKLLLENKIILISLAAFTGFCGISVFWSQAAGDDIFQELKLTLIIPLLFYVFLCLNTKYKDLWLFLIRIFIFSGSIIAVVLLINKAEYVFDVFNLQTSTRMPGYGRLENQNYCALVYGSVILLTLFTPKLIPGNTYTVLAIKSCIIILSISIVLLTGSRQGVALLTGMIGLMILISKHYKIFAIYSSIILAAGLYTILGTDFLNSAYNARGDSGRVEIWMTAIQQIIDTPIIGQGYGHRIIYNMDYWNKGSISEAHHAHSLYLSTAVRTGIIGLSLLLFVLGKTTWDIFSDKLSSNRNTYLIFIISGATLGLVDSGGYYFNLGVEYLYFWFPIAAYYGEKHNQ